MTDAASLARRWAAFRAAATRPTDAAALAVFRVALGTIGLVSVVRLLGYGWVDEMFARSSFRFTYFGFGWLPQPSVAALKAMLVVEGALALLVALGAYYRVAAPLFAVLFTWVELLDVTNYLNHYYLVTWLAALASVMPLHAAYSVDARRLGLAPFAPAWCTWLLRFQVGVVYTFAGLAKLQSDWLLHAQPLQIWLGARTETPLVGPWLDRPWVAHAMSWAGFLFDTTIALFLSMRRTRPFAFVAVLGFHAATRALFPIGMFPFIMISGALVFFSPSWPRRWLGAGPTPPPSPVNARWFSVGAAFAAMYMLFHVAMPLRTHLYGGDVSWHEQGMRFSWRVMVREKNGSVTYRVRDLDSGRVTEVNPRKYLSDRQAREFSGQPDLILQLAHHVANERRRRGERVAVYADTRVSWNGRPGAPLIDPEVDLARVSDGLAKASWILPAPASAPAHLTPVAAR